LSDDQQHQRDTFISTFVGLLLAMVGFTVVLILLAQFIGESGSRPLANQQAIELSNQRIAPVGQVAVATAEEMAQLRAAASGEINGEVTYQSACFSCHGAGVAGAPKLGDADAWRPRRDKGVETLYEHSIKGFNAMPPKGGFINLSDEQVQAGVDYMLSQVK